MKLLAVILSVALIASVSGQDMLRTMMLMRMLGGNNNSGSNSPARGSSASTGAAASMLGMGRGGFNPALLALGGDRMRDMMMCNIYPRQMRGLCMARAFQ